MATYSYDDTIMEAALSVVDQSVSAMTVADNAIDAALNTLRTISSAGGDLGAAIGGTVLGNVRCGRQEVMDLLNRLKQTLRRFESMRSILNGTASILDNIGGVDIVESFVNGTQNVAQEVVANTIRLPTIRESIEMAASIMAEAAADLGELTEPSPAPWEAKEIWETIILKDFPLFWEPPVTTTIDVSTVMGSAATIASQSMFEYFAE